MTTIAWDGKTLAADVNVLEGNVIVGREQKVQEIEIGACAATGYAVDVLYFEHWCRSGFEDPKPEIDDKKFCGVVVKDTGECYEYNADLDGYPIQYPMAWGSGWEFALAALDFGESAIGAVQYASTRCAHTSKDCHSYDTRASDVS